MIPSLNLFVAHAFEPRSKAFNRREFKNTVNYIVAELIESGLASLNAVYGVKFDETVISEALMQLLKTADIGLIEISDNNPNVLYEYGYLMAAGKPTILIRSKRAARHGPDVPADIKGRIFVEYDDLADLRKKLIAPLATAVSRRQLSVESLILRLAHIWFPRDVQSIHVIAAHEYESVSSISRNSENYTVLDRFCDKDAVLEVMAFLSRIYPHARVIKYTDKEFSAQLALQENLVIVGGPGSDGKAVPGGNAICRQFRSRVRSRISYSPDCQEMLWSADDSQIHQRCSHRRESDETVEDWGYFACMPNPYNSHRRVVMIHGLHTFGVLGGTLAFGDSADARLNLEVLESRFEGDVPRSFESYFKVRIEQGVTLCPSIASTNIYVLG